MTYTYKVQVFNRHTDELRHRFSVRANPREFRKLISEAGLCDDHKVHFECYYEVLNEMEFVHSQWLP